MGHIKYSVHLFAGGGGGLLADIISGIKPVCAIEIEEYPQKVLAERFPGMPIWDDVRTFTESNSECAEVFAQLREHADELVIAGGFPCQDISCAGKGEGISGVRSGLWTEFARVIREIRPGYVFVENSPLLVSRGLDRVLGDLAAMGYDAVWGVLSASAMGAMHQRDRIWITAQRTVANANGYADAAKDSTRMGEEESQAGSHGTSLTADGNSTGTGDSDS